MNTRIDNRDEFVQEYENLLRQFDIQISTLGEYLKTNMSHISQDLASETNRLKIHRYKLKEVLESHCSLTDDEFPDHLEEVRKVFQDAQEILLKVSKVLK